MTSRKINHKGQVALIMVLLMTIVSALVVSFAGRATSETRVQNILSDSTNAFLAARSGIEEALQKGEVIQGGVPLDGVVAGDKKYQVSRSEEGQSALVLESVAPGMTAEVALEGVVGLTGAKIYWTDTELAPASILVSIKTINGIKDYAFDSLGLNGFTKVLTGGVLLGITYRRMATVVFDSSPLLMKVTVLGNSIALAVGPNPLNVSFPAQMVKYRATGQVNESEKAIKYGLEYVESKGDKVPEVFNYALFSHGSIIQ